MVCSAKSLGLYETRKGLVVNNVLRTHDILDINVKLHPDGEDIALVASTNHSPKLWTIHAPTSKWPQCNYLVVKQGIFCKHVMKIFKMFHPHILDSAIVWKIGTLHGVQRGLALDAHINSVGMPN
jgi:hypothetical protein